MEKPDRDKLSLWGAAKFYIRVAMERPVDALLPIFLTSGSNLLSSYVPGLFVASILDKVVISSITTSDLIKPVAFVAISMLSGEILERIGMHFMLRLESDQMQKVAERTFKDLINRSTSFHNNNFSGSLVTRSSRLTKNFQAFYDTIIFSVIGVIATLVFVGVVMVPKAPWVYFAFYIVIGIFIAISWPMVRKRSKLNMLRSQYESEETAALADAITNASTIKAFANEDIEVARYHQATENIRQARKEAWNYHNLHVDTMTAPFYVLINTVSLLLAVVAYKSWGAPASVVFLSFNYFSMLSKNIWDLNRLWRSIESYLSEAAETLYMLNQPVEVVDVQNPIEANIKAGNIVFENVKFTHENNASSLFDGVSLHIKPKEKVGLIGPSGGGKTTITKLILRFMDLDDGKILIDGQDISQLRQQDLRQAIAYVPQEPILFHRTLLENIQFGKPKATKAAIVKAAKQAHADDFIESLPNKYDTLVGERGVKLSGGQRQRVAIARAMLKNSPILVLDEATSALDSDSEKLIQDALWKLMEDNTAIVVAHRLSTVQRLDRIVVLDEGKIVEEGTHQELLDKKGLYATLWNHQSGGFLQEQ